MTITSSQICYCTFHTLLYVTERRELKLNYKIELSPSRYIKEGVESTIKIWLEILANLHTLPYIARKRESSNKIRMSLQGIVIYNSLLY